ncbi:MULTISPECIES: DUF485 domain-containing protein [Duganella]|jgi:uncharacterized membrane protein (DUF485 family)|uniref:DUF485 domain-containing protein n=2 Tax=Duganella TaxID=75654 RepID=A0A7X4H5D6_9BURK|nr:MULTISPECIES: DUF485 domain-containing protein [Duganella]MYM75690.1 DUF485 domain-containing protein [Duganella margarita]MYN29037.1 DUF485 domain-containing protein [Duganella levis]MYN42798.1 DUF485 domain-containing protein [Duganella margarita]
MQDDLVQQLKRDPNYHELVKTRSRFGWWLTAAMMVVYYGYILLIAFDKEFLAAKTGDGVMTWGMPIGLFVIVFTVLITGVYVRRANNKYDQLTQAIHAKVKA